MQRAAQKSLAVMCPACSRSPDRLLALMESANRGLITRAVRELDPTIFTLQHNQLLPHHGVLCFKSALELEDRATQAQEEEYQRGHRCKG
jgi:hypothetical protein